MWHFVSLYVSEVLCRASVVSINLGEALIVRAMCGIDCLLMACDVNLVIVRSVWSFVLSVKSRLRGVRFSVQMCGN